MSVTQTIWKDILGMSPFEPAEPKGKKSKYGLDAQCWLCGGDTENSGHHLKDGITTSFTDGMLAKAPQSQTMCYSCVALMKKEAWILACEKHRHNPYFPSKEDKAPALSNWMFSSHVFSKDSWLRPDRKDIANILLNPPEPPFVMTFSDAGKKHVIFRAKVNHSRDSFFIQLDEETIFIDRAKFQEIHDFVKSMYDGGFSKDSILTGNYNQVAIIKHGLSAWRELETQAAKYRTRSKAMLKVACFVVQKESND